MKVSYALRCDESVRPEAEYAARTCLSSLGFFFAPFESNQPGLLLCYGELPSEMLRLVRGGEYAVRIQHSPAVFRPMVESGIFPRIEGRSGDESNLPILGPLIDEGTGTTLRSALSLTGDACRLISEESIGSGGVLTLHFDLFAGIFFFLSRIEEASGREVDEFGRFPQGRVFCAREGLEREPVVNRYMLLLEGVLLRAAKRSGRSLLRKLEWPGGEKYCVSLTHDVDRLARWRGRSILKGFLTGKGVEILASLRDRRRDPWWNLDAICQVERKAGVRSSFFFFANKGTVRGGRYDSHSIKETLSELAESGWEVALHGSYESMDDGKRLARERLKLGEAAGAEIAGVRQHYLRLKIPGSIQDMVDAGFGYDASVGFSDRTGFRSSMCVPFRLYDLVGRKPFQVLEIPIAVMDGALPLNKDARRKEISDLLKCVGEKRGLISLIWHQRSFDDAEFPGLSELYDWFLDTVRVDKPYFAKHAEVSAWWKKRDGISIADIQRDGDSVAVSFETVDGVPGLALDVYGRYILEGVDGAAIEESRSETEEHLIIRLSDIEKTGFSLNLLQR